MDIIQKDFFKVNEDSHTLEVNTETHFAAEDKNDEQYFEKLNDTCLSNTELCDKIDFYGSYQNKEKYNYIQESFSVIDYINEKTIIWSNFEWTINEIKINKDSWDRRWYATRTDILLNLGSVKNLNEFHDLITHELWHIFDLGYLKGESKKMHWLFTEFDKKVFSIDDLSLNFYKISRNSEKTRKDTANKKDFCSWYGMYDPFEDFAECFNLYLNHNLLFKTMSQKSPNLKLKFNFIASIFRWKHIKDSSIEKGLVAVDSSRRPWDTTRITTK